MLVLGQKKPRGDWVFQRRFRSFKRSVAMAKYVDQSLGLHILLKAFMIYVIVSSPNSPNSPKRGFSPKRGLG